MPISRRLFLSGCAAGAGCALLPPAKPEIIDTHTHFYDPSRPEGVPWPPKNDELLHRPVLPPEYERLASPHGITGTIVVEASPWVQDNHWVLDLAARQRIIRGLVGHLKPGKPGFAEDLQRFARNKLFRGIRVGGWGIPLAPENTAFARDLALLSARGLALDVLGGPEMLPRVSQLALALPALQIVIDHCAGVRIDGRKPDPKWLNGIEQAARHPNVNMKVSGLVEATGRAGAAPRDIAFYAPTLDALWDAFGENRLIFGSNWPVSDRFGSFSTVFEIVDAYFSSRGETARNKYFSANGRRVYRYI